MDANKLNSWLSLLANFGVILGIVLLVYEIRQNTDMMRAQINQSRAEAAMSEQQATYNSDHIPALGAKIERGDPLSTEDRIRYEAYLRAFNRNMDNQLWQYNQGLLGENIPRSMRTAVRRVIGGYDMSLATWDQQKIQFTDEYVAFVEEAIADLR